MAAGWQDVEADQIGRIIPNQARLEYLISLNQAMRRSEEIIARTLTACEAVQNKARQVKALCLSPYKISRHPQAVSNDAVGAGDENDGHDGQRLRSGLRSGDDRTADQRIDQRTANQEAERYSAAPGSRELIGLGLA